jgi:hypothetical protein
MEEVCTKRERRCVLSWLLFELLAFLLCSWVDAKTEGARAKLQPCGENLNLLVLSMSTMYHFGAKCASGSGVEDQHQGQPVALVKYQKQEVEQIYLPLSHLLQLYVAAVQKLYTVTSMILSPTRSG